MTMTLDNLAERIGATLIGDGSVEVESCASMQTAASGHVTFLANPAYIKFLETTQASAIVIDAQTACPEGLNRLVADDPYYAFRNAMVELHGFRQHPDPADAADVSPQASIHATATVGEGTKVHPNVVIDQGAAVGRNCVLYPGVYIGPEARVGNETILFPNVAVYDRCIVGNRVILHANTVIGHDGFGYATHEGAHHKIPQAGIAVIEDDVELGAGCAIERAAMGETRIGQGTKFADLISIGHGTTIGRHCLFVSLCGVSGSVDVGNYVVLGGQAGLGGHISIGDGVQVAAKAGVIGSVPAGTKVGGQPAIDLQKAKRNAMAGLELFELAKRVKSLEKQLAKMSEPEPARP